MDAKLKKGMKNLLVNFEYRFILCRNKHILICIRIVDRSARKNGWNIHENCVTDTCECGMCICGHRCRDWDEGRNFAEMHRSKQAPLGPFKPQRRRGGHLLHILCSYHPIVYYFMSNCVHHPTLKFIATFTFQFHFLTCKTKSYKLWIQGLNFKLNPLYFQITKKNTQKNHTEELKKRDWKWKRKKMIKKWKQKDKVSDRLCVLEVISLDILWLVCEVCVIRGASTCDPTVCVCKCN